MSGIRRIERLRDLVGRLEQLPESDERDRVLFEARARAVDVDTGATPRAMLPVEPAGGRSRGRRVARTDTVPEPVAGRRDDVRSLSPRWYPRPIRAPARVTRSNDLLEAGQLLCLEESPAPHAGTPGARAHRAWERGLRG